MIDSDRRTGRTTKMLDQAMALALQGKEVAVVGFSWDQVKLLQRMLEERFQGACQSKKQGEIRIVGGYEGRISLLSAQSSATRGKHVDEYFVDHAVSDVLRGSALENLWAALAPMRR